MCDQLHGNLETVETWKINSGYSDFSVCVCVRACDLREGWENDEVIRFVVCIISQRKASPYPSRINMGGVKTCDTVCHIALTVFALSITSAMQLQDLCLDCTLRIRDWFNYTKGAELYNLHE